MEGGLFMLPIGDDDSARRTVPVVTYVLITLNIIFFFIELGGGDPFIEKWAFIPSRFMSNPIGDFLTLFSSMFMHAGWVHLGGNMLYLWIFGDNVFRSHQVHNLLLGLRACSNICPTCI
jgi:membrane associated rhomboid family serine protease